MPLQAICNAGSLYWPALAVGLLAAFDTQSLIEVLT